MTTPDDDRERQRTADIVMYWMRRRGLTRKIFADRLGKSLSWVDKIKNGDRQLDRVSVLKQIAAVLDIPLTALINPERAEQLRLCPDEREIDAIRHALQRYDTITNVFRPNGDVLPEPDLDRLERAVRYGWMAFQASNYQAISAMLPELIRDCQAAAWQLDGDDERSAKAWLAWTYQLTASTAFKLGDPQLGWIAADRGVLLAEQTHDLTLIGNAALRVVHALFATAHAEDGIDLVRAAADRLNPHLATAGPAFASAYGMLLLKGSIAAAQLYQAAAVRDFQDEALSVATTLGDRYNENWLAFGVTNVRIHQVSALADMQAGGRVIEAAHMIQRDDLLRLPRERQAAHALDVATGYLQSGKRDEATNTLLDADQFAPQEVRCRSITRQLITDLMHSYPRTSSAPVGLTKLARATGVTV